MKAVQNKKRSIDGLFLLDKPIGISSNSALQMVKHLFDAKKAGHTGSLDPLATGMLPVCFGQATKFSQFLLEADKTYWVKATLGVRTTTSDAEGEVIQEKPVPNLSTQALENALDAFRGLISQTPSMYSALKHKGQPLYKLARQGKVVERKPRHIHVYQLTLLAHKDNWLELELRCSKGTYVRTLVDDLGEQLGCGAHVSELRRTSVGAFKAERMITLTDLRHQKEQCDTLALDHMILPISSALDYLPKIAVTGASAFYLRQGQAVNVANAPSTGNVCLTLHDGALIGVGEIQADGKVAPKRLVKK